jgi:glycosyltransferase involved in cell wall biosynthesis
MDTNNKAILLMNSTSAIGGAQKRYINLFNYISRQRNDYFLIINKSLYLEAKDENLLVSEKNVKVIDVFKKSVKVKYKIQKNKKITKKPYNDKKKFRKIRKIIWLFRKFYVWLSFAKQFRTILKKNNIDLVYGVWLGGIWSWPLKYIFNYRLIHSYNDSSLSSLSKNIFRVFDSEYWVLKNADKIDFLSEGIITRLEKKIGPIPDRKKTVTPNSFIDYTNFYPQYPKSDHVVFMSRLVEIKNPILFLDAIRIYNQKYSKQDVKFFIVGEGPLENDIRHYVFHNKLNNVFLLGSTFEPWKYLSRSKVFMSLQRDENYPSQSVLEAMACENAIIASDVGETRKLVTEEEGMLVKLDAEEIADALNELISNPKLRKKKGENARKKALEEHNIEKYSEYFFLITDKEKN